MKSRATLRRKSEAEVNYLHYSADFQIAEGKQRAYVAPQVSSAGKPPLQSGSHVVVGKISVTFNRESHCATIDGERREFRSVDEKVRALIEAWDEQTGASSVVQFGGGTYLQIIGIGKPAIRP